MQTVKYSKTYLFKLSLPIFVSNLGIPLVGIVDTGLMGHLSSTKFLAATSISTAVIAMLFWSFGFLRMSTVGLVAQEYGRDNNKEIILILIRNIILAIYIGLILLLIQKPLLQLIQFFYNNSFETQNLINKYISIRIYSAPAELLIYVLVGFFLGLQKTQISSLIIIFFSIINILLSIFFVVDLDLEISGVALGTSLSAYITVLVFFIYTYFFVLRRLKIIPNFNKIFLKKKLLKIFSINFDIFIRTILLTFSFLWITYKGAELGEDYLTMNSILMQFILLSSFILDSYAFSTEAVVGYTIGKKSYKPFLLVVSNSFKLSIVSGLIISFIYLIFFKLFVNILTDIDYLRFMTYQFIIWVIIIPPFAALAYQFDGIFIGASQTSEIRNSMLISVTVFIVSSIYMINYFDNHGLWASLLFFMIIRAITLNFYFNQIVKKF